MHLDVLDLRAFYYRSALGRAVQTVVRKQLLEFWPEAKDDVVVGFGFAVPLLRPFLQEARRVTALMPGPQGVMPWPARMPNVSVLCADTLWPVQTGTVTKLVLMHGLETSDFPGALLDECWRVLAPGGRAVVIVPNRSGLWSRSDKTPFGYGRPYSMSQLEGQLRAHGFVQERGVSALFQPPTMRRRWRRVSGMLESVGRHIPGFAAGGVLMVEASKQVPAPRRPGLAQRVRAPLQVLDGIGAAEPSAGRIRPGC